MRPPQSLLGMEVRSISGSQRGWKAKHQKTWLLTCLPPKKSAYQLELQFRTTGCETSGFQCSLLSSILWSLSTFGHGCNLLSYARGAGSNRVEAKCKHGVLHQISVHGSIFGCYGHRSGSVDMESVGTAQM